MADAMIDNRRSAGGPDYPPTPTLDRITELRPQLDALGEFLDWLRGEGYVLGGHRYHPECRLHEYADETRPCRCELAERECWGVVEDCPDAAEHADWLWRIPIRDRLVNHDELLAQFFGIDLAAAERERRGVLERVRAMHEEGGE